MLRARDLVIERGAYAPVSVDVFDVAPGETIALVGPNGSGRSTVLRALAGAVQHAGTVEVDGRDVSALGVEERLRAGVALAPAGRRLFGRLSVEQNLVAGCAGLGRAETHAAVAVTLERLPILQERRTQRAGTLSGGEGQQLMIARALVTRPKVVLVDDPLEGLSTQAQRDVLALLAAVAAEGTAVILAAADPIIGVASRTLEGVATR